MNYFYPSPGQVTVTYEHRNKDTDLIIREEGHEQLRNSQLLEKDATPGGGGVDGLWSRMNVLIQKEINLSDKYLRSPTNTEINIQTL